MMQKKYYQIYNLLDQLDQWPQRLKQIRKVVQKPDFQYEKEDGADLILGIFLRSSYWLDRELFDESYLYRRKKQKLSLMQEAHFQMVEIGAALLGKGFPLRYNSSEYSDLGPNQLRTYVKIFVKQCQKKALLGKKVSHKSQVQVPAQPSRLRE